ncbi:hypothetical protein ACGFZS_13505 [Streptomyces sp. NPDC048288]|uniref:hypothetical protein n=1 Tax=Streptomyces sp. NPDC048288 TaxID=3365529 RepID=UPI00371BF630
MIRCWPVGAPADWAASSDEYLALVYDGQADELRLYVGSSYPAATAGVAGANSWTPTGALQAGRTLTRTAGRTTWPARSTRCTPTRAS